MNLAFVPSAPREPSARARRLVFRLQGAQLVFVLVGAIFLVVGVPLGLVFCWDLPAEIAISLDGQRRTARFVEAHLNENVTINEAHPTSVVVEYAVDGVLERATLDTLEPLDALDTQDTRDPHDSNDSREGTAFEGPRPGDPIEIEVARRNPRWARLVGQSHSLFGYFGLFALIGPLTGTILVGLGLRANARARRAFRLGVPALGRVTRFGLDRRVRINRRHPWRLDWSFEARDGRTHPGSVSSLDADAIGSWEVESEIVVLYDPANPAVNTVFVE